MGSIFAYMDALELHARADAVVPIGKAHHEIQIRDEAVPATYKDR